AVGDRERREDPCGDARRALRDHEEATAIRAVGDDTRDKAERQAGDRAREPDEAEVERRELRDAVLHRELHDEPAETEDLHPGPDVRDDESGPEQTEIAVAERRDERGAAGSAALASSSAPSIASSGARRSFVTTSV